VETGSLALMSGRKTGTKLDATPRSSYEEDAERRETIPSDSRSAVIRISRHRQRTILRRGSCPAKGSADPQTQWLGGAGRASTADEKEPLSALLSRRNVAGRGLIPAERERRDSLGESIPTVGRDENRAPKASVYGGRRIARILRGVTAYREEASGGKKGGSWTRNRRRLERAIRHQGANSEKIGRGRGP